MDSALPSPIPEDAGDLLDRVLAPLLQDFEESFARGLVLVRHCPERVMDGPSRERFRQRLEQASAQLAAARALRAAAPAPMALDMDLIRPWHELVVEVWGLSAALRAVGIRP
jgi:hypothetical protein